MSKRTDARRAAKQVRKRAPALRQIQYQRCSIAPARILQAQRIQRQIHCSPATAGALAPLVFGGDSHD
jgi:hypothetical protein